ncbi:MAG: tyrosine-type recombinase/integrase [Nitrososphaerales archaeon]
MREELRRLEKDVGIPELDRGLISRYVSFLEAQGLSNGRLAKAAYQLRTLRRHMSCDFATAKRADIEQLVIWLNRSAYAPWSKSDAKGWIKRFYRWLRFGTYTGPFPEEVAWIKTRLKINELTEPEILTTGEVKLMIEKSNSCRDRALIAVLYESGFRIGEALNMRIADVVFDGQGARVRVSGKTGPRTVRLITSSRQLAAWIEEHPQRKQDQAWVWASLAHSFLGCQLEYHSISTILKETAKGAGLQKRVYPHLFRHSAATRDAHFLNEAELRIKYGWQRNSTAPSIYVHLAAVDVEQKLIAIYSNGENVHEVRPDFTPVRCPRCNEKNTPGVRFCARCGLPLDQREIARASSEFQNMRTEIAELKSLIHESISATHPSAARGDRGSQEASQPSSGEGGS